jgi:hypothetical protein
MVALLETADIGIIIVDNINDTEATLTDRMAVGIIITTQVKI